jgi:hypothetical protein
MHTALVSSRILLTVGAPSRRSTRTPSCSEAFAINSSASSFCNGEPALA